MVICSVKNGDCFLGADSEGSAGRHISLHLHKSCTSADQLTDRAWPLARQAEAEAGGIYSHRDCEDLSIKML
eukprot:scaffold87818_cov36-Tisochrysis_lutea.AAC.4